MAGRNWVGLTSGLTSMVLVVQLLACAREVPGAKGSSPRTDGWGTDYEAALASARSASKVVLADFTGSDWCSWCQKLRSEVFATDEFRQWAGRNVILLELDYPRHTEQEGNLKLQNTRLLNKAQVEAFPTVVFWDASGTEIGRMGYVPGGPTKWIEKANAVIGGSH